MSLCAICDCFPHYCRSRKVRLVTNAQLESDAFRRDVRLFLRSLRIPQERMLDFLSDCYRDADCATVVDRSGQAVEFELDELEFRNFPWWVRDLCRVPPEDVPTRLRPERREAFRKLATLLILLFPSESMLWGVRPANDNEIAETVH